MRSIRRRATTLVGVIATLATSLVAHPAATAAVTDLTKVTFRVVAPDGRAVPSPVVAVSVFGKTYSQPRILSGSPLGEVVVPLPVYDPVAAQRLADGEAVNMLIRVFDKAPGSDDINAAYVAAAVGVDAYGVLRELSNVTGTTVRLTPGRTAFEPVVAGTVLIPARTDGPTAPLTDETTPCDPVPNRSPVICHVEDLPPWSYNTLVPIADNHGAGNEMVSNIRYSSTVVTETSVAVQVGAGGFFRAEGSASYSTQRSGGLGFAARGPNDTITANLETIFARTRSGMCMYVLGEIWQCQYETTYRPHWADGTYPTSAFGVTHDTLDPTRDCFRHVDGYWEPGEKTAERHEFRLQLGPNENWGPASEGMLYANTETTQQTNSGLSFVRKWSVAANGYVHHWVFVPYGRSFQSGLPLDNPSCVSAFIGNVMTDASNTDYRVVYEAAEPVSPTPLPDPPDGGEGGRTVCGRMPDKCD